MRSHIDEFNPNDYFIEQVFLDVIPDVIYDITGTICFQLATSFALGENVGYELENA